MEKEGIIIHERSKKVKVKKEVVKLRISDTIEEFIKSLFNDDDFIEIQRNELAEYFNCVPSQINYVISTRFSPSQRILCRK